MRHAYLPRRPRQGRGAQLEDALSTANQEGREDEGYTVEKGKVGKEEMWVGGCWCLLIKCKRKAAGMQTDMSNFWVCCLGGVWKDTSTLGELLLENLLCTHREDLQTSHPVNSVVMRQHDRGRAQGHQKERRGHPGDEGPGCRGRGGGEAGGRLVAKGAVEGTLKLRRKGPGKHRDPRTTNLGPQELHLPHQKESSLRTIPMFPPPDWWVLEQRAECPPAGQGLLRAKPLSPLSGSQRTGAVSPSSTTSCNGGG